MRVDQFVAHRGFQANYPENTLIGIEASLDAGARWIEIDIQLSSDGVPVVIHDPDLQRTAGVAGVVAERPWSQLAEVEVAERQRFGSRFDGTRLNRLRDVLALVARYPQAAAFIEIKKHCLLDRHPEQVAEAVLADVGQTDLDCPVISFEPSILQAVRAVSEQPIGLVLHDFDRPRQQWLREHLPQWVFCNYHKVPVHAALWDGPWRWVMYPVNDVALAAEWLNRGATLIETDDIGLMMDACDSHRGAD